MTKTQISHEDFKFLTEEVLAPMKSLLQHVAPDLEEIDIVNFIKGLVEEVYLEVYSQDELVELIQFTRNQKLKEKVLLDKTQDFITKFIGSVIQKHTDTKVFH